MQLEGLIYESNCNLILKGVNMFDLFIGNYERILGNRVFIKQKEKFVSGTLESFLFGGIKNST